MNDYEKVSRLETALRTERDHLRTEPGIDNQRAANAINEYLQKSDTDSKLRFANILLGSSEMSEVEDRRIRSVS